MKRLLMIGLMLTVVGMTACGSGPGSGTSSDPDPVLPESQPDSPSDGNGDNQEDPMDPQQGDPDGDDSGTEPGSENEDGMVFEEDEGMEVSTIQAPPEGRYEVTYSPGTINCPGPGADTEFPPGPTDFIDVTMSQDLLSMTIFTNEGSIEMGYVEDVSPSGEILAGYEGVLTVGGLDLVYSAYYDVFGLEEISGEIYNEEQGCITRRPYTAARVGP